MAKVGKDIAHAADLLRQGKLVGIPTDTVYGLAANAFDPQAVARIFEVKKRPTTMPIIAQADSIDKIKTLTSSFSPQAEQLAGQYWPGALTLVVDKNDRIPDLMTSGGATVGVRIPNHEMTLKLLTMLDFPLAVPSANIHGEKSPVTAEEVNAVLGDQIDYILDGGTCAVGFESTIVGVQLDTPILYRQGAIAREEIEQVLGQPIQVPAK